MNNNGQLICLKTQWRKTWWDWVCLVPYPQLSPSVICSCSPNIIFIALTTFGKRSTVNISQKYLPDEIDNQLLPLVLGGGQPSPRRLALLCTLKLQEGIPGKSLSEKLQQWLGKKEPDIVGWFYCLPGRPHKFDVRVQSFDLIGCEHKCIMARSSDYVAACSFVCQNKVFDS